MAGLDVKRSNAPDEGRSFDDTGHMNVVTIGGHPVLSGPWEAVVALVGAHQADRRHRQRRGEPPHLPPERQDARVMDDGTEAEIGPDHFD